MTDAAKDNRGSQVGGTFAELAFHGRAESVQAFLGAVLQRAPSGPSPEILELGCGTGDLSAALAQALPGAKVTGVDISAENIATAKTRVHAGAGVEVSFFEADYIQWKAGPFDIIAADSVLQWIEAGAGQLAAKIADDLASGGLLIATVPAACATNTLLVAQRRIWRRLPRALDAMALRIAQFFMRAEDPAMLADRINYLRLTPQLSHTPGVVAAMRHAGLRLIEDSDWPGASAFKLRHRLVIYRKYPS